MLPRFYIIRRTCFTRKTYLSSYPYNLTSSTPPVPHPLLTPTRALSPAAVRSRRGTFYLGTPPPSPPPPSLRRGEVRDRINRRACSRKPYPLPERRRRDGTATAPPSSTRSPSPPPFRAPRNRPRQSFLSSESEVFIMGRYLLPIWLAHFDGYH